MQNSLIETIKSICPSFFVTFVRMLIHRIKELLFLRRFKTAISQIRHKHQQAIIIMATPVHGNLGDHAIVYAEQCLLHDMNLKDLIIEISNSEYVWYKKKMRKYISDKDIIVIDGGGNMGTLWPWEDDKLSEIISSYKCNPIIIFPQTCFYGNSYGIQDRLERNRQVYVSAKNLLVTLRDAKSFNFCRENFPTVRFALVPDIVLYLGEKISIPLMERTGVILCFRQDLERIISVNDLEKLQSYIKDRGINYKEISTVRNYNISKVTRVDELTKIWKEFASSRLVITDRLHGMIFSVINRTPCLALDNVSKKVSGVYELLPEKGFLKICSDVNEILKHFSYFYGMDRHIKGYRSLDSEYQIIRDFVERNLLN